MPYLSEIIYISAMCVFTLIFIGSGTLIVLGCLVAFLLLRYPAPSLYRTVLHYLYELFLSIMTNYIEVMMSSEIEVFGDANINHVLNNGHNLIIMNHKYDSDFVLFLAMADQFRVLGSMKCHMKSSLLSVPLLGIICWLTDNIFIKRDWATDQHILRDRVAVLADYPASVPVNLLLLAEGTRFTPEKQLESVEYARANGLVQLNHHLLPRPRGFLFITEYLRDKFDFVINGVFLMSSAEHVPTSLFNIITRKKFRMQFLLQSERFTDMPKGETDRKKLLYDSFEHKDKVFDMFYANGGTLEGLFERIRPARSNWIFWIKFCTILILSFVFYGFIINFVSTWFPACKWHIFSSLSLIFILLMVFMHKFVQLSKPVKNKA